ncbi:MAG: hypothetical protein ACRC28_17320 [Clostridium sp.]|uniref:hypothetical protein n=1 Tax=Clostridium sp. TaxID=1506 RepID=UPI003F2DC15C
MEELTTVEIKEVFGGEENLEEFFKYLKEYGIEEGLNEITFKHTKKRLETLLAIANKGKDAEIASKKDVFKKLLNNLDNVKEERASKEAIKEVYSNEKIIEHMDIKELDKEIKHAMKSYKKYEKFKKHEENIANKWIRTLGK